MTKAEMILKVSCIMLYVIFYSVVFDTFCSTYHFLSFTIGINEGYMVFD